MNIDQVKEKLAVAKFPRSNKYDPLWVIENNMGPNSLWLTEFVCQAMHLKPGMRVLDLGCGRGMSSIFLAKEYGVEVWAADLWIKANEIQKFVADAGVENSVFPLHLDARDLPFADNFFDAMLCIDSFIYFGTDDLYLDSWNKFVKPGGEIGVVMPGFMQELDGKLPEHLEPFWAQECWTWHTLDWWKWHWQRTGLVNMLTADTLPDGWKLWEQWTEACILAENDCDWLESDLQVLRADQGRYMGFIRMIAERA